MEDEITPATLHVNKILSMEALHQRPTYSAESPEKVIYPSILSTLNYKWTALNKGKNAP